MKVFIAALSFLTLAVSAHAAKAGAKETASTIPDLILRVKDIKRPDEKHVIFVIEAVADVKARDEVRLEAKRLPIPKDATQEDIDSGVYDPRGFSLLPAEMVDETTGQKYSSVDLPRGAPFLGSSRIKTSLQPGASVQMAICVASPPPLPPDASGKPPEQKVTLTLPNTVKPITGLVLPSVIDSPKTP